MKSRPQSRLSLLLVGALTACLVLTPGALAADDEEPAGEVAGEEPAPAEEEEEQEQEPVPPARGGEITVTAAPERMVLGEDEEAEIRIELPPGTGRIELFAAVGRVSDLTQEDGNEAAARYRPPRGFMPRVDAVAVLAEVEGEVRWGYTAIPLVGRGEAEIRTRPFVEATIDIDGEVFGPVKADRRGRAIIPVSVPPGVGHGFDGLGAEVDLHVPSTPRTAVFVAADEIPMDEPAPVDVLAVVFDIRGGADEAEIVLRADRGEIVDERVLPGGAVTARFVPPGEGRGMVRLQAGVDGDAAPFAAADIVLIPGAGKPRRREDPEEGEEPTEPEEPIAEPEPLVTGAVRAGFAWNTGAVRTFHVGLDLGVRLPVLDNRLFAGLELGLSRTSDESRVNVGSSTDSQPWSARTSTWLAPFSGAVAWRPELSEILSLAATIRGGVVLVDNEVSLAGPGDDVLQEERSYHPTVGGGLALEITLGVGAVIAGVDYLWIITSPETVAGNLSMLYFDVGYRIFFL